MISPIPETVIADSRWAIGITSINTGVNGRMPCLTINARDGDGDGFVQMKIPLPPNKAPLWEDIGFFKKTVKDD
jgi:hypothetical protein